MKTKVANQRASRRGVVMLYSLVAMIAFVAICSLAVDYGRVQLSETELQSAADAAARAGAGGLAKDPAEAVRRARMTAAFNLADGSPVDVSNPADVEVGEWDKKTNKFKPLFGSDLKKANAVRVIARRTADRGKAVPLSFAAILGQPTCNVNAEAIAMLVPAVDVNQDVKATANPFLAGMKAGTVASLNNPHNSPDYAGTAKDPRQSPLVVGIPLEEGQAFTFDSISGTARHDPNLPYFSPDGELTDISHNTNGAEHGIADMNCPINALVGVFLSDAAPDLTATPAKTDYSSAKSRDFAELKPQLKQTFFIGDGKNAKGERQKFVAPKGATRLYLATWDFYEWNNNAGNRIVKVARPEQIVLVK